VSHRLAAITILAASLLDAVFGVVFAAAEHRSVGLGLYWAVATATTVGYGDVTPHTALGHVVAVAVMLTVVPLFAASFSLFTSALAGAHIVRSEHRIKQHVRDVVQSRRIDPS
jgi:voltage-gated potassium channel